MTLAQIRTDERVYQLKRVDSSEYDDADIRYELSLDDGYQFSDGTSLMTFSTVAEINAEMEGIKYVGEEVRCQKCGRWYYSAIKHCC